MPLPKYSDIATSEKFKSLPWTDRVAVTDNYWNQYEQETGDTEYAGQQRKLSTQAIDLKEEVANAHPVRSRVAAAELNDTRFALLAHEGIKAGQIDQASYEKLQAAHTAEQAEYRAKIDEVKPFAEQSKRKAEVRTAMAEGFEKSGVFGSVTAAAGGAVDKGIQRLPTGEWDLPILMQTTGNPILDTIGGATVALAQKTGARLDAGGMAIDKPKIRSVFDEIQKSTGASDAEMQAAWMDIGNSYRKMEDGEKARVLSDGTIVPNYNDSDWLNPEKAAKIIDSLPAPELAKELLKYELKGMGGISQNIAHTKLEAYTTAAILNPLESPVDWAKKKGRIEDYGTPKFVEDYEKEVASQAGVGSKLLADYAQGGMKLISTGAGAAALASSFASDGLEFAGFDDGARRAGDFTTFAGKVGAEVSKVNQLSNQGMGDTPFYVGKVIEELPSLIAQAATTKGIGAGATAAGFSKAAAGRIGMAGMLTTAGMQSAGMTYSQEIAAGASEEVARSKATKAGLNTALITGFFQKLGMGGSESAMLNSGAAGVAMRDIFAAKSKAEMAKAMGRAGGHVAKGILGEGLEEGWDEFTAAFLNADPDTSLADAWANAVEAAKIGAVLGGGMATISSIAETPTHLKGLNELERQANATSKSTAQENLPETETEGRAFPTSGAVSLAEIERERAAQIADEQTTPEERAILEKATPEELAAGWEVDLEVENQVEAEDTPPTAAEESQEPGAAKIEGASGEAKSPVAPASEPVARVTRHRVFEGGSPINVKPGDGVLEARDPSKAYRVTGQPQIDDVLETGEVRAKEGKMRGGRRGETQWSRGDKTLGYDAAGNSGRYVIETSAEGLNDRQGGLPKSEVSKIYKSDGTKWVDVTDQIISPTTPAPKAAVPTELLPADAPPLKEGGVASVTTKANNPNFYEISDKGGNKVGQAILSEHRKGEFLLDAIDIDENEQKKGYGTTLMKEVAKRLVSKGATVMYSSNEGQGTVQILDRVFGRDNVKHFIGQEEISYDEAVKYNKDYVTTRSEVDISNFSKQLKPTEQPSAQNTPTAPQSEQKVAQTKTETKPETKPAQPAKAEEVTTDKKEDTSEQLKKTKALVKKVAAETGVVDLEDIIRGVLAGAAIETPVEVSNESKGQQTTTPAVEPNGQMQLFQDVERTAGQVPSSLSKEQRNKVVRNIQRSKLSAREIVDVLARVSPSDMMAVTEKLDDATLRRLTGGADNRRLTMMSDLRRNVNGRRAALPSSTNASPMQDDIKRKPVDRVAARVVGMDTLEQLPETHTPQPKSEIPAKQGTDKAPASDLSYRKLKANEKAFAKIVKRLVGHHVFRVGNLDKLSIEEIGKKILKQMTDNILFVYDSVPENIRTESKKWYKGANKIANMWSEQYAVSTESVAGVIAALSPQKDWFQNVSLAERVLDIWTGKNRKTDVFGPEMQAAAAKMDAAQKEQAKGKKYLIVEGVREELFEHGQRLKELMGRKFEELGILDKAFFIRLYDETYNSRSYAMITPDGRFGKDHINKDGSPTKIAWGTVHMTASAVSMLENPSLENISAQLGHAHKIRSFYNNIINPDSDVTVTSDTHAVAVAYMMPLSGAAKEVTDNFGGITTDGYRGTYAFITEAYRLAAKKRGVKPSEMQSVTWEAIRDIFPAAFKRNTGKVDQLREMWNNFSRGRTKESYEIIRQRAYEAGGGYSFPSWYQQPEFGFGDSGTSWDRTSTYSVEDRGNQSDGLRSGGRRGNGRGSKGTGARTQAGRAPSAEQGTLFQDGETDPVKPEPPNASITISTNFGVVAKAFIELGKNANASSAAHEAAHLARRVLFNRAVSPEKRLGITDEHIAYAEKFCGAKDGVVDPKTGQVSDLSKGIWNRKAEEKFARGFEKYIRDGVFPEDSIMLELYQKLATWLQAIYKVVEGSSIDIEITPEMREIFDLMVTRAEKKPQTAPKDAPKPKIPARKMPAPKTTSVKNAETDKELVAAGFEPLYAPARKALQESLDQALAAVKADPLAGKKVVESLHQKPHALNDVDHGLLLDELAKSKVRAAKAEKVIAAAAKANDPVALALAQEERTAALNDISRVVMAAKLAGTEWGRAGRFRQIRIDEDYSIEAMMSRWQTDINNGQPINAEQEKLIKKLRADLLASETARKEAENALAERGAAALFERDAKAVAKEKPAKPRTSIPERASRASSAMDRLKARLGVVKLNQEGELNEQQRKALQILKSRYDKAADGKADPSYEWVSAGAYSSSVSGASFKALVKRGLAELQPSSGKRAYINQYRITDEGKRFLEPQLIFQSEGKRNNAPINDSIFISVNGREADKVFLSKNTIPGEKPYRATWFQKNGEPSGHTDLTIGQYTRAINGDNVAIEDADFKATLKTSDPQNPLQDHPDLGIGIGGGERDGSLESRVLNLSQRMQRGYPEIYATIQSSLPKNLQPIAVYATGIRTNIYEHIGDLPHRAGSSELRAMLSKIKSNSQNFEGIGKLEREIAEQDSNNAAFQIAIRVEKSGGKYDISKARNSSEFAAELEKAKAYNTLLDGTYAAIYSRLQSFTPLQAAGRNMAIAFGMQRYGLYQNIGKKIQEFFDAAEAAGIKPEELYKYGFDVRGVGNLSRTNNELKQQWEKNKEILEKGITDISLGDKIQRQLREQVSHSDLEAPLELLDQLIDKIKSGVTIKPFTKTSEITTSKGLKIKLIHRHTQEGSGKIYALSEGKEIGYLPYGKNTTGDTTQIGDMDVLSSYRRKGVATSMLKFARSNGVDVHHYENESDMSLDGKAFKSSFNSETLFQEENPRVEILDDLSEVGLGYFDEGITTLEKFTEKLVADFGEEFRSEAETVFGMTKEKNKKLLTKVRQKTPQELASLIDPTQDISERMVYNMVLGFLRQPNGPRGAPAVLDAVTELLKKNGYPDITREEVVVAYTNYGRVKHPSQEQIKLEERELKILERLGAQLADIAKGLFPKKTGSQHDKTTSPVRSLMKQIKQAMIDVGMNYTDAQDKKTHLAGARDHIKQQLLNFINDMQYAIDENIRIDRAKRDPVTDDIIKDLQEKRDVMKKRYDAIFGIDAKKISVEAQIKKASKMLDRQINLLEAEMRGEILDKPTKVKLDSPELKAKRDRLEALREAKRAAEEALNPAKTAAELATDRLRKGAEKSIERFEYFIKNGTYPPKADGTPATIDDMMRDLLATRDRLRDTVREIKKDQRILTPPEVIARNRAVRQLNKTIADLEARIAKRDFSKRAKKPESTDPEVVNLKATVKSLRATLDQIEKDSLKPIDPEEKKVLRMLAASRTRRKKYLLKLRNKDYVKDVRKDPVLDARLAKAVLAEQRAKAAWNRKFFDAELAKRGKLEKAIDIIVAPVHAIRTLKTIGDVSAPHRQGILSSVAHPILGVRNYIRMWKAGRSQQNLTMQMRELENSKYYLASQRGDKKLFIAKTGEGATMEDLEEAFQGRLVDKIPIVNTVKGFSERTYNGFLNGMRMDHFAAMADWVSGGNPNNLTKEQASAIANYVNIATGRGNFGKHQAAANLLSLILFSPKFMVSRFQWITGVLLSAVDTATLFKLHSPEMRKVRQAIALEHARSIAGMAALYSLYVFGTMMYGADEDDEKWEDILKLNPLSSKAGRIKVGDTYVDPAGGLLQTVNFLARTIVNKTVTGKDELRDLDDPGYGQQDYADVLQSFVRSKLAPIPSAFINIRSGSNMIGQKATLRSEAISLITPMIVNDTYEALRSNGMAQGLPLVFLMAHGVGLSTRDDKLSLSQEAAILLGDDPAAFEKKKKGPEYNWVRF